MKIKKKKPNTLANGYLKKFRVGPSLIFLSQTVS